MNGYRPTRAGAWLGTWLEQAGPGGDFVTSIVRNGAALGFSEAVIRGAFAEIRASARPGGHVWALDDGRAQFFRDWAAQHAMPAFAESTRKAYAEFWRTPIAGTPTTPQVQSPTSSKSAPQKPVYDPPLSPTMEAFYARQRSGASLEYGRRAAELARETRAREAEEASKPRIDSASIYARRKSGAR